MKYGFITQKEKRLIVLNNLINLLKLKIIYYIRYYVNKSNRLFKRNKEFR